MSGEIISGLIGAGLGYGGGQALEQFGLKNIHRNRQTYIGAYEGVDSTPRPNGGILRPIANLAMTGLFAGTSWGLFVNSSLPQSVSRPEAVVIADQDFTSGLDGSAAIEDKITSHLISDPNIDPRLVNAHNGTEDKTTLSSMEKTQPYGPPSVDQAVSSSLSLGFSKAPVEKSNLLKKTSSVSGAEIVLVNANDSIGSQNTVVAEAKAAGNIPIYIADINSTKNNPNVSTLQDIAKETGGYTWFVNSSNQTTTIKQMEDRIRSNEQLPKSNDYRNIFLAFAIGLTLLEARLFERRSKEIASS